MNKFFFVAFFVLTSAYSQYSRVTVYDQYGNNLGYYNVESDYLYDYSYGNNSQQIARQIGNEIRMAVNDLIEYIEERESRAAAAKARELFNRRAAKYGLSSNEVFGMGESGINPAMEAALGVMEAAERRKRNNSSRQGSNYSKVRTKKAKKKKKDRNFQRSWEKLKKEGDKKTKEAEKKLKKNNVNISISTYTDSKEFLYDAMSAISDFVIIPENTSVTKKSNLIGEKWYKIEVNEGKYKGKTGYLLKNAFVTANNINTKLGDVARLVDSSQEKYQNGDLDGAITDCNKAINIDKTILRSERSTSKFYQSTFGSAYAYRGFYFQKKGELDKAIQDFTTAIDKEPEIIFAYHFRGKAKELKEDFYGAISDYSKAFELNKEKDEFYSNINQSILKYTLGDANGAIEGFKKSLNTYPISTHHFLSKIYANENMESDWNKNAEEFLSISPNQVIEFLRNNPDRDFVVDTYLDLFLNAANSHYSNKEYEKMREKFVTIIEMLKDLTELGYKYDESDQSNNYRFALFYNQLAVSKRESGDYYGAISDYSKALEYVSSFVNSIGGIGTAKFKLGDKIGACNDWKKAVSIKDIDQSDLTHYGNLIKENCN